jgi:hypothetical protein
MLSWTIQTTIISIILIFLIHHLINFFKSALTVPKIKDLVNVPHKKYENIFNVINNNSDINIDVNNSGNSKYDLDIEKLLPKKDINMKNELKNFIKKQFNNNDTQSSTSIDYLDNNNSNNYSFI